MAPKQDATDPDQNEAGSENGRQDKQRSESKSKPAKKDAFLEYFTKYKETHEESLNSKAKDADPVAALKRLEKEQSKCVGLLFECKHPCEEILN